MKVAIMQPYVFPYLGYFQLIKAVDHFVYYDDVNFIKGGWINRNRILVNGQPSFLTIPLEKASPNKLITDINIRRNTKEYDSLLKTIEFNYKKAPFFREAFDLVQSVLFSDFQNLSDVTTKSINTVCDYLDLRTVFHRSSIHFSKKNDLSRDERLIDITKKLGGDIYINPIGGQILYEKDTFLRHGIDLMFIKSTSISYKQYLNDFVPSLSIIDIMMFNSKDEINYMLGKYELI